MVGHLHQARREGRWADAFPSTGAGGGGEKKQSKAKALSAEQRPGRRRCGSVGDRYSDSQNHFDVFRASCTCVCQTSTVECTRPLTSAHEPPSCILQKQAV